MIPCLARSAVIIKSKNNTSILLSNYELAYGLGLLSLISEIKLPGYSDLVELKELFMQEISNFDFSHKVTDPLELNYINNLIGMILKYIPNPQLDEQMKELLQLGLQEKMLWNDKEFVTI